MDISPEGLDRLRDLVSADPHVTAALPGGGRVGKYRLLREVGRGGMATVYEAEDTDLKRTVALKIVRSDDAHSSLIARLRREAKIIAQLRHPHIVAVHEVGTARDAAGSPLHYIAMEFVRGRTLALVLAAEHPPRETLLRMMEDVARAVAHAHSRGIVHRDLKPGNVLVDDKGRVQLVDFGLAYGEDFRTKLTATQSVLGTPQYMAPEQVRGDASRVGPPTDVYALGVMLYEVLGGRPPFTGRSAPELYAQVLHDEPPSLASLDPSIDARLTVVCGKAMEKDAARRYPTAEEFADDLARARFDQPIAARPPGLWRRARAALGGWQAAAAIAACGVVVLAAIAAALLPQIRSQQERALRELRKRTQTSLDACLALRRAGSLEQMQRFADETEEACRETFRRYPDLAEPHYILGVMWRTVMKVDEALAEQDAALAKDPNAAEALYQRVVLTAGRYEDRLKELRPWSWRETPSGKGLERARAAAAEDDAARGLMQRLEADVERLRALVAAGKARIGPAEVAAADGLRAWLKGDPAAARERLSAALEASPDLEEAVFALASVDMLEEKYAESVTLWTRGLEHDKGYLPYREGRAFTNLAWGFDLSQRGGDAAGKFAASIEDHRAAIAAGQAQPETMLRLGIACFLAGQDQSERGQDPTARFTEALRAIEEVGDQVPRPILLVWRGIVNTAWARHKGGRDESADELYDAAFRDFEEALRLSPKDAGALLWRGVATASRALAGGRSRDDVPPLERALHDLDGAVQRDAEDPEAWMWRGITQVALAAYATRQGQDASASFAKALRDLDQAVKLDPENAARWCRRGQAQATWGAILVRVRTGDPVPHLEQAGADYGNGGELNPAREEAWLGRAKSAQLLADWKADHGEEAATAYRAAVDAGTKAVKLDPGSARTQQALGEAWEGLAAENAKHGRAFADEAQRAMECFEAAIKIDATLEKPLRPRIHRWKERLRK